MIRRAGGVTLPAAGILPLPLPVAAAAAIGSGLLYWLAFPARDVWPLAFVAWVPLLLAMHRQTVRNAALLGWLTGITMNVAGFFWLQTMLETFSGFAAPLCLLFLLLVCVVQGGRVALLGWVYGRGTSGGWPLAPVFVGAFVVSELLYPLLFPWYYGATVHQVPLLSQTADLGGPIAVGVVLVLANLAIAEPLLAVTERRRVAGRPIVIAAAAVLAAVAYGALRVRSVDAAAARAPGSTVGIAQANLGLMEKRTDYDEGLRRHLRLSTELRARGADFLVWSETSVMHAVREESYRAELRSTAQRIGLPAVFGAVIVTRVPDAREYVLHNSAVTSDSEGRIESRYDKEYLLTFGEYLPFGDVFPILYKWSPNSGRFSPGTSLDPLLLDVGGTTHRISALICYEDVLPAYTNDSVRHAHPELLVNLTNDAWFLDTAEPWQHLALAEMRAIEHHRYLVRGTNSGVSAVVDPVGRLVTHSATFQQQGLSAPIRWMQSATAYELFGNWPWALASVAATIACFTLRPPSSRGPSREAKGGSTTGQASGRGQAEPAGDETPG